MCQRIWQHNTCNNQDHGSTKDTEVLNILWEFNFLASRETHILQFKKNQLMMPLYTDKFHHFIFKDPLQAC